MNDEKKLKEIKKLKTRLKKSSNSLRKDIIHYQEKGMDMSGLQPTIDAYDLVVKRLEDILSTN